MTQERNHQRTHPDSVQCAHNHRATSQRTTAHHQKKYQDQPTVSLAALLLALAIALPALAAPETAKSADGFVDSIGVNTHYGNSIFIGGNAYANPAIDAKLGALGIRHLRDHSYNDAAVARVDGLFNYYGIKTTLILGETSRTPADLVTLLKNHPAYEGIEGLNEPDFNARSWNGFTDNPGANDYSGTRAFQNDLYNAVKADPATQSRMILSPAMGNSLNSQYLPPIGFDVAAMHSYPSGLQPSNNLDTNLSRMATLRGTKPLMATETGYYNLPAADTGSIPENVAAKYMLRLYGETFNRGIARTYVYELADQGPDATQREQNFGLLRFDMSEKPAYTATRNLIDLLEEPVTLGGSPPGPYTPGSLDYTITSSSSLATVHHTLLQKSDGRFYLMLWNETAGYNRFAEAEINVAPIPATITFNTSIALAKMYLPNDSPNTAASYLNPNSINFNVLDKLTVFELNSIPEPTGAAGLLIAGYALLRRGRRRTRGSKMADGRWRNTRRAFSIFHLLASILIFCSLTASAHAAATYTLTTDGAWTWFNDPRAVYLNNNIYTGWVDSGGFIKFAGHNLATHTTTTATLYNGNFFQSDDHDNPAFLVNSPTSLTAFYAPHGGASVRMQDITIGAGNSFTLGPVVALTNAGDVTGSNGWTYANPYRLSVENKTYLFSRGRNFNPVMRIRDDSTGTWGAATNFILNSGQRPYVKYHSDNTSKVGFAFTDGHPRNVDNNIYYAYLQNNAYWRVDGTKIKDVSAGPLSMADMQTPPGKVFDRLANPAVTGSDSWIWDVAADASGNPVVAFSTFPSTDHHQYHWAKWNPATQSWIDRILVKDAGPFISMTGEENYSAGLSLDPTDPNIVYASWMNARTYNLLQYKANDSLGATWATQLIAAGTGPLDENLRPYVPLNRPVGSDNEMVLYLNGQYDWWDNSKGAGYDTGVKLWTRSVSAGRTGDSAVVPEPGAVALLALIPLLARRRR